MTINIKDVPRYHGAFTRDEAPQAKHKNGARVFKSFHEEGDATPLGTFGTVLGSVFVPGQGCGYFVEWDNAPKVAVFVVEGKIHGKK